MRELAGEGDAGIGEDGEDSEVEVVDREGVSVEGKTESEKFSE